ASTRFTAPATKR
ncbi:putrescine-ornithine antiporter, partial [Vibrio parahaemolyticus V-223/04]